MSTVWDKWKEKLKSEAKSRTLHPFWRPQQIGEEIVGEIVSIRPSPWEKDQYLYDIKTPTGTVYTLPRNVQITDMLTSSGATVGYAVYIQYIGEGKSKKGRRVKQFKIACMPKAELEKMAEMPEVPKAPPKPPLPIDKIKEAASELAKSSDRIELTDWGIFLNKFKKIEADPLEAAKAAGLSVISEKEKDWVILR